MGKAENDRLRASSDVSTVNALQPKYGKEHRREVRYMASWRVAVSVEGQDFHCGRVKDISLHGAAILNDFNVKSGMRVTSNIYIPTLDRPCEQKVLIVHGISIYTVYDADRLCFRVGISFVGFEQASDRDYLEERLTNYHIKVPDYVCRRSADRMI